MNELQLMKIQQRLPRLFGVIEDTIQSVYREIEEKTRTVRNDPLIGNRIGYVYHVAMEHCIRQAIEESEIEDIIIQVEANGKGALHLVIVTPYARLTFARVRHAGDVPRKAKFRQKYIDQAFISEVYPELAEFTPECIPLYVITYAQNHMDKSAGTTHIGRLTVDQDAWSCNYPLLDLIPKTHPEETINAENRITPHEHIKRSNKISIKNQ